MVALLSRDEGEAVGVEQFESFAAVLDADSRGRLFLLFHDAVLGLEDKHTAFYHDFDVDGTVDVGRGAVLEGILHEGDENHGGYLGLLVVGFGMEFDVGVFVEPQRLQVDILSDVVDFVADGYGVEGRLGVHVFQYVGELNEGRFRLVRLGEDQPVKGVERVEEEVRIDLRLVQCQLGLVFLGLDFLLRENLAEQLDRYLDGQTESRDYQKEEPHAQGPDVLAYAPVAGRVDEVVFGYGYLADAPGNQQEGGEEYGYEFKLALHDEPRYVGLAVGEVEQVDVDDEGKHEIGVVDNPLLYRYQHDEERQDNQTEYQVDVGTDAGVVGHRRVDWFCLGRQGEYPDYDKGSDFLPTGQPFGFAVRHHFFVVYQ